MRATGTVWRLEPLGIELVPVGLTGGELDRLHAVVAAADAPLIDAEPVEHVDVGRG